VAGPRLVIVAHDVEAEPGVSIHVRVDGPVNGTPVVMLHGYVGRSQNWDRATGVLTSAGYRVFRFDHRGHGRSTHVGDESAYDFDRLRLDVLAVADALDIGPFHLVGHSMGGLVALLLSIENPERLSSVMFVDCSPLPGQAGRPVWGHVRRFVGYRIGAQRVIRILAPALALISQGAAADLTWSERFAVLGELADSVNEVDPAAFVAFGEQLGSHGDLRPHLGAIDVTTTVIVGEFELARLRAGAEALVAGIADARFEIIDGAGHSPPTEKPERFNAALLNHLASN